LAELNSGLKKAHKKRQEMRDAGIEIKKRNPYEILEDNPKSMRAAINAKCYDCNGEESWLARTKYCNITDCSLWSFRKGGKGISAEECIDYDEYGKNQESK